MKIKDLIYQTPEMTEEKLLEIIAKNLDNLKRVCKHLEARLRQIHKYSEPLEKIVLKEFDLIQDKKSYLSKSERDIITGFVGICLIKMTKGEDKKEDEYVNFEEVTDGGGDSSNTEGSIPEVNEAGNVE